MIVSEKICAAVEKISMLLGCALLLLNVGDILFSVAARYFFNAAPVWTEELARFSLVWMVLIGAAGTFLHSDQMSIEFVTKCAGPKGRALCRFVSTLVQAVVLAVLIWFGAKNVIGSWKMKTMALGVPKSIPLLAVPLGMSLFLTALLAKYFAPAKKESE